MCLAFGLMSDSMYFRALAAISSSADVRLQSRTPVSTTPVTPGLLFPLHEPWASCDCLRYASALSTVSSHCFGSGPTRGWARASAGESNTQQAATIRMTTSRLKKWHHCILSSKGDAVREEPENKRKMHAAERIASSDGQF